MKKKSQKKAHKDLKEREKGGGKVVVGVTQPQMNSQQANEWHNLPSETPFTDIWQYERNAYVPKLSWKASTTNNNAREN